MIDCISIFWCNYGRKQMKIKMYIMLKKKLNINFFNFNFQSVEIIWFNIDNSNNKLIFQQAYNYKEKRIHYMNEFHAKLVFSSQNKQTHVQITSCFHFVFFSFSSHVLAFVFSYTVVEFGCLSYTRGMF